jgi:hypothetical protein
MEVAMRLVVALLALALPATALAQACPLQPGRTGGFATMAQPGGPVAFRSALQVNMDGAPNAYHRVLGPTTPDPGLLHICNGVDVLELREGRLANRYPDFSVPGSSARCKADVFALQQAGYPACSTGTCLRIYGFAATPRECGPGQGGRDCGVPIQARGPDGQATGFFVSTTSLQGGFATDDPRRYVDARFIPHIALPGGDAGPFAAHGVQLGDIALLVRGGRAVFAVFADGGPRGKLGEASGAAINRLNGVADSPNRRPAPLPNDVTTLILPGSRALLAEMPPRSARAIADAGQKALEAAGGRAAFAACPGLGGDYAIAAE